MNFADRLKRDSRKEEDDDKELTFTMSELDEAINILNIGVLGENIPGVDSSAKIQLMLGLSYYTDALKAILTRKK